MQTQRSLRRSVARFLIVATTSALATPQAHTATISTEVAVVDARVLAIALVAAGAALVFAACLFADRNK